jgi:hypothetical protein
VTSAELRALADDPFELHMFAIKNGPDAARLLADAMEFMSLEADYVEHHPDCALYLPQKECDCGVEDREALLARFSALGRDEA